MFDTDITWYEEREEQITNAMQTTMQAFSGQDLIVVVGVLPRRNAEAVPMTASNVSDYNALPLLFEVCARSAQASIDQDRHEIIPYGKED